MQSYGYVQHCKLGLGTCGLFCRLEGSESCESPAASRLARADALANCTALCTVEQLAGSSTTHTNRSLSLSYVYRESG